VTPDGKVVGFVRYTRTRQRNGHVAERIFSGAEDHGFPVSVTTAEILERRQQAGPDERGFTGTGGTQDGQKALTDQSGDELQRDAFPSEENKFFTGLERPEPWIRIIPEGLQDEGSSLRIEVHVVFIYLGAFQRLVPAGSADTGKRFYSLHKKSFS